MIWKDLMDLKIIKNPALVLGQDFLLLCLRMFTKCIHFIGIHFG